MTVLFDNGKYGSNRKEQLSILFVRNIKHTQRATVINTAWCLKLFTFLRLATDHVSLNILKNKTHSILLKLIMIIFQNNFIHFLISKIEYTLVEK